MKYQLDIISDSVGDLVLHAGGWIYDRVTAGWEVNIALPLGADPRPVRILGAAPTVLDITGHRLRACRPAIATSVDFCRRNGEVAKVVASAARNETEVTMWGEDGFGIDSTASVPVSHRLSVAARAFKTQALAACGDHPLMVCRHETFRSVNLADADLVADLVPAG
ncbi:hypothetical protein GIY30_18315 [Gordonia sp. HNM0687]|uniref:Uncharacterized protein n=1 Tax=Gordonia mangrovi TaxID=2665643 RepID=A0A6L7GTD9_9ACTN|nr:hypothetical protein [Gordonia mangrovi]MXP23294.1 hypothetical protein [Gordonia mangrovi]UVF76790.1 hypothetical protein NWF22_15705 [Gordonia mangrovi]